MAHAQRMAFLAVLGLACLAGLSARAQDAPTSGAPIPGYYDPATRTFTALAASAEEIEADKSGAKKLQKIHGKLTIKAVVDLVSDLPKSATFRSTVSVTGGSRASVEADREIGFGQVQGPGKVARKGDKATVTVTMPYNMAIDGSAKTLNVNVTLGSNVANVPSIELSKNVPIPKNGAKTTVAIPGAL